MGLFNDESQGRDDEVVIEAPEEDNSTETRLGQEVESSIVGDSSSSTSTETDSSDVSLDDIHRQNETIIDLLEELVDRKSGSGATGRAGSSSSRVTDRSSRVTDREDSSDNDSIGEGMNELL